MRRFLQAFFLFFIESINMSNSKFATSLIFALVLVATALADEPKPRLAAALPLKLPEGVTPESLADPKEAVRVAELIEKQYPKPHSEAVRMLLAVLRGLSMEGKNGWFGPADTRYTWEWLLAREGLDATAEAIPKDKFHGPAKLFDRLDRDGDGKITKDDLDWSDGNPYVQQAGQLNRIFRRMNTSGDGKLTRDELEAFFKQVADGKDYFSADDLRRAMIPAVPAGSAPATDPPFPCWFAACSPVNWVRCTRDRNSVNEPPTSR